MFPQYKYPPQRVVFFFFFFFFDDLQLILLVTKMEKYLSIVENSQPKIEIEKDKLIFFISKVPIWEHFGIRKISHLSSTVDEKKILLNKYYSELYTKYYGTGKNLIFFCLFFGLSLLFGFFWLQLIISCLWFVGIKLLKMHLKARYELSEAFKKDTCKCDSIDGFYYKLITIFIVDLSKWKKLLFLRKVW